MWKDNFCITHSSMETAKVKQCFLHLEVSTIVEDSAHKFVCQLA